MPAVARGKLVGRLQYAVNRNLGVAFGIEVIDGSDWEVITGNVKPVHTMTIIFRVPDGGLILADGEAQA
jgi:hypothetical protein